MSGEPLIVRSVEALRDQVGAWRRSGLRVGLVPTMGALHEGHVTLVRAAFAGCDRVVVSIFVNPRQFAPSEDFALYPRREADDLAQLAMVGAQLVFMPPVEVVYPAGFATAVTVTGSLTQGLCAPFRPGHFQGVATVVAKLFLQCLPDAAYFGEKDWQQLQVVRRMTRDLDIPVAVVGVATVREPDGLALSSRNIYLSPSQRETAAVLPSALREGARRIAAGDAVEAVLGQIRSRLGTAGFAPVDYVDLVDAISLEPVRALGGRPLRLAAAAWLGRTRLIDNWPAGLADAAG
jgi:pantoate--beta-alanine ligase